MSGEPVAGRPHSVDDVLDPRHARGPLAATLRPARRHWVDALAADELTCPSALRPYLLSLFAERHTPLLVLTPRSSDAEVLADGLQAYLGDDAVAVFPAWETLPHERLSPQPATVGRRLAVLDRLVHGGSSPLTAIVAPVRAALQPMDRRLRDRRPVTVTVGPDDFDGFVAKLAGLGYVRTPQVTQRGEFAVRGGIIDVFPAADDHAVRIEFFGDDVESVRTFAVADQRSIEPAERVTITAARELVLDDDLRARARTAIATFPELTSELDQLADGHTFDGVESLALLLSENPALLVDFLPPTSAIALVDPILLEQRARALADEIDVLADMAWRPSGSSGDDREASGVGQIGFADPAKVFATEQPTVRLASFAPGAPGGTALDATAWDSFRGDIALLGERLQPLLAEGHRIVISADAEGSARRVADVVAEHGLPVQVVAALADEAPGRIEVTASSLPAGFRSDELGLAVLGTWDVFGPRRRRASRRLGTRATAADTVLQLQKGDAVVHRTHGVGRFRGMVSREFPGVDGRAAKRDYVLVEYANGDTLYVPSDQVDALARYQGGETPRVMSLGGAQWERAKNRVRKAVRDIAAELIRLYAARMHAPGHAFGTDGSMQSELEDAFAHVETVDQLTVLDEIKQDMEAPLPMDRLLAGDVGFGKTEVAIRAAAKAVFDGTQVAVLVPTTILAQQHVETFTERFSGFPVVIEELSRFVTPAQRRAVLDRLAAGTVDIVVGTHALLAPTVTWKNLGLVIVDEEQRFGVQQKERLKQLRTHVDVLSMSATPIPRTLEMAVSGIRDLSVIETPPEDRQPVHTIVGPWDEAQITLAVRRELLRDGQVFYVHNQVETIHGAAAHLAELVPGVRVEVAHGQMDERQLERVMVRFWQREFDVLVCTTIIESGLDVPNANTLVIERADLLGLAQLHQLRGRVGRSAKRGYAYLFYPQGASLTEPAYERLRTIAEHTRLGSGLAIAARDLEIRGAGNIVGAEQSGHVAAVGFDMYAQLLQEEVADLTGSPIVEEAEIRVDVPIDAHLPQDYVADANQRLELYQRIAAVRDSAGVADVRAALVDRFGPVPPPADRLLALAAFKAALRRWGITEVAVTPKGRLRVAPVTLAEWQRVRLDRQHPGATVSGDPSVLQLPLPRPRPDDMLAWTANTLRDLYAPPPSDGH
ncbi:MAG: transcription-repair coupling factor [Nitriliruptoraceae bacterium]